MPEFQLNTPPRYRSRKPHPFYDLSTFAKGYVEAMFFTNGDCGDDRENLLNDWGVEKLTRLSVAKIADDCEKFQRDAAELLTLAYATNEYEEEQAGRDFWFTRQGHGVGFWDRDALKCDVAKYGQRLVLDVRDNIHEEDEFQGILGRLLSDAAKQFGECYVEAYRGWIHVH